MMKDRHFFFALGLLALPLTSTTVVVVVVVVFVAPRLFDARQLLGLSKGQGMTQDQISSLSSALVTAF
jgi:hypothetical protein